AGVEASFAPWSDLDRGQLSAFGVLCSGVCGVEVVDAEIDMLGIGARAFGVAICKRVVAGEDGACTVEVVAACGNARSFSLREVGVKGGGHLDVGDRQDDRNSRGISMRGV